MKHNPIGIKDIAHHAGVSTGPVDKVLNNRGGVSKATEERILQAIKELGYTPNILASRLKSAKQYMIAVLIPEATDEIPYWQEHKRGFEDAADELIPFGFNIDIYHFQQNNERSFAEQSAVILNRTYDGVFMVPVFDLETIKLVTQLKRKRIPVIFFDTQTPELTDISFIGQHSTDSGFVAAELLYKCLPLDATVLIISLSRKHDNHNHFISRENGFRDFFKDKDRSIIKYENMLDDDSIIKFELTELINTMPTIQGVFVTNGIHKVAPAFSTLDRYTLIGYDLIEQNVNYLSEGVIDFLISQRPYTQAHSGIRLFYDLLLKKKPISKMNYLPIDIVTKSNLKYYSDLFV